MSAASPAPSTMPPPNLKRPRQSAAAAASANGVGATATGSSSRVKRRKAEDTTSHEAGTERSDRRGAGGGAGAGGNSGSVNFGVGMVKGREEEYGEAGEVHTKIDFKTLPIETLYKYLEHHDLLPRFDTSPWSEEPCTPPNALYSLPPIPPAVPIQPEDLAASGANATSPSTSSHQAGTTSRAPSVAVGDAGLPVNGDAEPVPPSDTTHAAEGANGIEESTKNPNQEEPNGDDEHPGADLEVDATQTAPAPTTRSKTAPSRKPPTPPPTSPSPAPQINRGVMTLSDVYAARDVLAEKANAHWIKGLGGGQNKEGETIVNFLYKMKVGPARLLRVYNPPPGTYPLI